jgi:hypothetical protein
LLYFQRFTAKNKKMQDLGLFALLISFFVNPEMKKPAGSGGLFLSITSLAVSAK